MLRNRWKFWIMLVLLGAAFLRLYAITEIPPGMTHDEADHGLDAWGVVNGIRPIYFTVGYGREPLFDYMTAALMAFLGPTFLAGRLTAVFFSLLMIAATYSWVAFAFDRRVALLTAAGLAVGFWSVMTGRHALRSVTMPALFTLSVAVFWRGRLGQKRMWQAAVVAGVLLGLSFYSYMPARILWALFPGLILLWLLFHPDTFRKAGRQTGLLLAIGAVIAFPLFYYLRTNPGAEVRLTQLTGPLTAAWQGDFEPLLANLVGSLRIFVVQGDTLWRYNIPGKPLLDSAMGFLFCLGLLIALWRAGSLLFRRRWNYENEASVFALVWLMLGMVPAFITGPEASTTRVIGMQPVLYLFPALSLATAMHALERHKLPQWRLGTQLVVLLFFLLLGARTYRAYFLQWGTHPEVRVQYETTLVTAIEHLNQHGKGAVSVSNPAPDAFHSPATALMVLRNPDVELRWFNGHASLLVPQTPTSTLVFPGFAELSSYLQPYFINDASPRILPLAPGDIDSPLTFYTIDGRQLRALWQKSLSAVPPADFGGSVTLLGYDVQTPSVRPGEQVRVVTRWQSQFAEPDLVLFTHVVEEIGQPPIADANRLDAPSVHWIAGDQFLQLHQLSLPDTLPAGSYHLLVGVFRRENGERLVLREAPPSQENLFVLPQVLQVEQSLANGYPRQESPAAPTVKVP